MKSYFVTGTDTEIGKTYATCLLARALAQQGKQAVCFKPVAAGAELIDDIWKNDDALALQQASNVPLSYAQVNPFCFKEAIAPHIAAEINQQTVTLNDIVTSFNKLPQGDYCLVEGAGGFLVPLNNEQSFADIPKALNAQVILVVGMRLGCINHALLTAEAVRQRGLKLAGWIANQIDPDMNNYSENLETLSNQLAAPMLAEIKHGQQDLELMQSI